jgi:hypothetical protein
MKKSLTATNPYLLKPALKKEMVRRFITSSSAIEGIIVIPSEKPTVRRKRVVISRDKA